jgi:GTP-binding protein
MEIYQIKFEKSSAVYTDCPQTEKPEYAFIGRSNVGKSSLINMLSRHKNLARISSQPGKTQLINHFLIADDWYLVDLPGYGFAKVGKQTRVLWQTNTSEYILKRVNLACVFVLVDSRIPPQKIDLEFLAFLGENSIPFVIVFTKTDRISKSKLEATDELFKNTLLETWEELPLIFYTSANEEKGRDEILKFIDQTNKSIKE